MTDRLDQALKRLQEASQARIAQLPPGKASASATAEPEVVGPEPKVVAPAPNDASYTNLELGIEEGQVPEHTPPDESELPSISPLRQNSEPVVILCPEPEVPSPKPSEPLIDPAIAGETSPVPVSVPVRQGFWRKLLHRLGLGRRDA